MPRGRGHGPGKGRCRRSINRFLEPCLLLLLHGGESHGYELIDNMSRFGFTGDPADSSTIYRILRSLEARGFATSRWAEGDSGPSRRVYALTGEGDRYLQLWTKDLEETDRILHCFFNEYSSHMNTHHADEGSAGEREE